MKQEEKEFCENCPHYNDCGFISRGLEYKCDKLDDFSLGWEMAIEKTCEWLQHNVYRFYWQNYAQQEHGVYIDKMLEQFKQAMQ